VASVSSVLGGAVPLLVRTGFAEGLAVGVAFGELPNIRWKSDAFFGFGVGEIDAAGEGETDAWARTLVLTAGEGEAAGETDAAGEGDAVVRTLLLTAGLGETVADAAAETGTAFLTRGVGVAVGLAPGMGVAPEAGAASHHCDIATSTAMKGKSFLIMFREQLMFSL